MLKKEIAHALHEAVEQVAASLVDYRRDFHRHAEPGWCEFRTASRVARRLADLGYDILAGKDALKSSLRTGLPSPDVLNARWKRAFDQGGDPHYLKAMKGGYTAVVATIGSKERPRISLRFDMDALEIPESTRPHHRPLREKFTSINNGVSHACGHDGHIAAGLGIAEVIASLRKHLRGSVRLVFQPAEEGVRGARAVAGSGVLDGTEIILAHHLFSDITTGAIIPGLSQFAATEKIDADIIGKPSHAGGSPESGKNALLAAATAVLNLHAIPRHSGGWTRVNVGKLTAGTERNIIADRARLFLETRGQTDELNMFMREEAIRIIKAAAAMHRCSARVRSAGSAPGAVSNDGLVNRIADAATALGIALANDTKAGISEDFTWMMRHVQNSGGMASMIGVGARPSLPFKGNERPAYQPHTPDFDFDETALVHAVRLISTVIFDFMHERR